MLLALLAPGEGGRGHAEGKFFVEILWQHFFVNPRFLSWSELYCGQVKNLIGGGAAGGAPVPQLGLPQPGAGPGPE